MSHRINAFGFSLVELTTALAVFGITTAIAVPNFSQMLDANQVTTATQEFSHAVYATRQLAITRNTRTTMCAINGQAVCDNSQGWSLGWMIFEDRNADKHCSDVDQDNRCDADGGEIIRYQQRSGESVSISGNHNVAKRIYFKPTGYSPFSNGRFVFCNGDHIKGLVLSNNGRLRRANGAELLPCPG